MAILKSFGQRYRKRERDGGEGVYGNCVCFKRVDIKPGGLLIKACFPFKQCCRKRERVLMYFS